ncbi:hypothetical protein [Pseudoalteromonas sp. MTN2-4]|uniref:hypothetical protein n=1 Tax=Pseudoalteromonas sp. MTN2-4 TaxID=3056555 RepID=UPI0036F26649
MENKKSSKYNQGFLGEEKSNWQIIKTFASICAISVLTYKIAVTPVDFKLDFPTLLSLLLAFFSVGLSALFYFKATETSNSFYDNTHKFTREISILLSKIESGFGERLKHLDENYSSVRDYIHNGSSDFEATNKKILEEMELVKRISREKDQILKEFLDQTPMKEEEKESVISSLTEKDEKIRSLELDIKNLKANALKSSMQNSRLFFNRGFKKYVYENIIVNLEYESVINESIDDVNEQFAGFEQNLASMFIEDLKSAGIITDEKTVTRLGIQFFREVLRNKEPH